MDKNNTFIIVKPPSQETIFARFLQKKATRPTEKQLGTWYDDGGQGYDHNEDYLAIVHGRICRSPFQKMMAHLFHILTANNKPKHQPHSRKKGL